MSVALASPAVEAGVALATMVVVVSAVDAGLSEVVAVADVVVAAPSEVVGVVAVAEVADVVAPEGADVVGPGVLAAVEVAEELVGVPPAVVAGAVDVAVLSVVLVVEGVPGVAVDRGPVLTTEVAIEAATATLVVPAVAGTQLAGTGGAVLIEDTAAALVDVATVLDGTEAADVGGAPGIEVGGRPACDTLGAAVVGEGTPGRGCPATLVGGIPGRGTGPLVGVAGRGRPSWWAAETLDIRPGRVASPGPREDTGGMAPLAGGIPAVGPIPGGPWPIPSGEDMRDVGGIPADRLEAGGSPGGGPIPDVGTMCPGGSPEGDDIRGCIPGGKADGDGRRCWGRPCGERMPGGIMPCPGIMPIMPCWPGIPGMAEGEGIPGCWGIPGVAGRPNDSRRLRASRGYKQKGKQDSLRGRRQTQNHYNPTDGLMQVCVNTRAWATLLPQICTEPLKYVFSNHHYIFSNFSKVFSSSYHVIILII